MKAFNEKSSEIPVILVGKDVLSQTETHTKSEDKHTDFTITLLPLGRNLVATRSLQNSLKWMVLKIKY